MSCGCGCRDPALEAVGSKLTWIPYTHLQSVHPGRELQELSLRPSPNPPHRNHCSVGTPAHRRGISRRTQPAHGLGLSAAHAPDHCWFLKPFSPLLPLPLAELQGEFPAMAEGRTSAARVFDYAAQSPRKSPAATSLVMTADTKHGFLLLRASKNKQHPAVPASIQEGAVTRIYR